VAGHPLRALCVGLQNEPVGFKQHGFVDCVEVRLAPSYALDIGLAVGDLHDRVEQADHLFGRQTGSLAEQLAETPASERPALIRGAFRACSGRVSPSSVTDAIRWLERADLSQTIGELVGDIGGSRSTLWRKATAALGMSPKQYLMLRRFEQGTDLLSGGYPIASAAARAWFRKKPCSSLIAPKRLCRAR
jgi:AraC-like DNA-binding protein